MAVSRLRTATPPLVPDPKRTREHVAVLYGGRSSERAVSLRSGMAVRNSAPEGRSVAP